MTVAEFTVAGQPVPQGSARAFAIRGQARIVTVTARLADWRHAIATEARAAMAGRELVPGPVAVTLHFRPASRPASHFLPANRRRPAPELRADAPEWHIAPPDADKLCRAALDALTGVVWADDRQVARLVVTKQWPEPGEAPGVDITIRRLEGTR